MLMKVRNWCVLGLSLMETSGILYASPSDGFMPESMPNLEGATYVCKGTGTLIEVHIKAKIEDNSGFRGCDGTQCRYRAEMTQNGTSVSGPEQSQGIPLAMATTDGADSWTLRVLGADFQLVSQFFGEAAASSNLGPTPFYARDAFRKHYPKVSCTLSLKL